MIKVPYVIIELKRIIVMKYVVTLPFNWLYLTALSVTGGGGSY